MNLRQFTKWSGKRSPPLVFALKVIWFLSIFTGEYIGFWKASHDCAPWPKSPSWNTRSSASRQELSHDDHRQVESQVLDDKSRVVKSVAEVLMID